MQGAIGFLTDSIIDLRYVPDRVEKDGLPVLSPGATDGQAITQHMALHLPAAWVRMLSYYESFGVPILQKRAWAAVIGRSFDQVPFADGMAYSDPQTPWIGFGFHDTIWITGLELMSSLMLYRGILQRAVALFQGVADPGTLAHGRGCLPASRPTCIGCTMTASAAMWAGPWKGRQFSVWANGVAYSLAPPNVRAKIAQFYRDNRTKIFLKGCTRQIAEDGWTGNGPGSSYQNGGFWATGTGFVLPAIYDKDPIFAADMAEQLLANLPGTDFAEWLDPSGNGQGAKSFLVGLLALPLIGLDSILNNKPLIENSSEEVTMTLSRGKFLLRGATATLAIGQDATGSQEGHTSTRQRHHGCHAVR